MSHAVNAAVGLPITSRCDSTESGLHCNLAKFDLVSLNLVVLCARHGSISSASKQMHCSLSAGSYRLSALEDMLGIQLFTRDHRGLKVTSAGKLVARRAQEILDQVQLLNRDLHVLSGSAEY